MLKGFYRRLTIAATLLVVFVFVFNVVVTFECLKMASSVELKQIPIVVVTYSILIVTSTLYSLFIVVVLCYIFGGESVEIQEDV